jgi:rhodanese-related sulfurtransferase
MIVSKLKAIHDSKLESKLPPAKVAKLIEAGALIVDVRTRLEAKLGIAKGATNIPLRALKRHIDTLPRDRDIVLYCGTGARAGVAKEVLDAAGFKAFNGGSYKDVVGIVGQ